MLYLFLLAQSLHVIYQSLDSLKKAVHMGNEKLDRFCGACFDGNYPTGDITQDDLDAIEKERRNLQKDQLRLDI